MADAAASLGSTVACTDVAFGTLVDLPAAGQAAENLLDGEKIVTLELRDVDASVQELLVKDETSGSIACIPITIESVRYTCPPSCSGLINIFAI